MARGINKVILIGNLGGDPETRAFPNGDLVTNATLATSESWKDKQTGEQQERTEWHRLQFHRRLAEIAQQYLHKGSKVYIEGSLRTRKYQDKQTGADRYATDIVVREMQMLDSRQASDPNAAPYNNPVPAHSTHNPGGPPQGQQQGAHQRQAQGGAAGMKQAEQTTGADFGDFDDDIPF